ncbi:hypothetical protein GN156_33665, partial [bacterium LRH843]|nr:hypothetical protein [bacterium LRH843]
MILRKRLITILIIVLCAGGVYAAGHFGLSIRQTEDVETEEESVFG